MFLSGPHELEHYSGFYFSIFSLSDSLLATSCSRFIYLFILHVKILSSLYSKMSTHFEWHYWDILDVSHWWLHIGWRQQVVSLSPVKQFPKHWEIALYGFFRKAYLIACLRMKEVSVWCSDLHCASDSLKTSVPVLSWACMLKLASNSITPERCLVPFHCANRYKPTGPVA